MLTRPLLFALSLGLAAGLAGCLLDSSSLKSSGGDGQAGASSEGGGGGQAGTPNGGGGSSGGSGGTSAGGAGGTTTPPSCATKCNDNNECTDDVCEAGQCKNKYRTDGTVVADSMAGDCQKDVCDGLGKTKLVPDDQDKPAPDGSDCHDLTCQGGAVTPVPKSEGMQGCDGNGSTTCHHFECKMGACVQVNEPDGKVLDPGDQNNCADKICQGGEEGYRLNDGNCPDMNPDNCYVPDCKGSGSVGVCGAKLEDILTPCKTSGGNNGLCDLFGNCVSL